MSKIYRQTSYKEYSSEVIFHISRSLGRTVFLSSHNLPEVERVADRVGIVRGGRLIAVDGLEGFRSRVRSTLSIEFASPVDPAAFADVEGVGSVEVRKGGRLLRLSVAGPHDAAVKAAAAWEVRTVSSEQADLDEVFFAYYEEGGGAGAAPPAGA